MSIIRDYLLLIIIDTEILIFVGCIISLYALLDMKQYLCRNDKGS